MAIQVLGQDGTTVLGAESAMNALRVAVRPINVLSYMSLGVATGVVATPAATTPLISFRYTGTNVLMVKRIGVGAYVAAAVTTSQAVRTSLWVGRSWTVSDTVGTGGTTPTLTGSNNKHRTSLTTATGLDVKIAGTAVNTAGTRTLDANAMGMVVGTSGTAVGTVAISSLPDNLFSHNTGDYPLVFATNEGFIIQNDIAIASGSMTYLFNIEFAELVSY